MEEVRGRSHSLRPGSEVVAFIALGKDAGLGVAPCESWNSPDIWYNIKNHYPAIHGHVPSTGASWRAVGRRDGAFGKSAQWERTQETSFCYSANGCARCTVAFCPHTNRLQACVTLFPSDYSIVLFHFICMSFLYWNYCFDFAGESLQVLPFLHLRFGQVTWKPAPRATYTACLCYSSAAEKRVFCLLEQTKEKMSECGETHFNLWMRNVANTLKLKRTDWICYLPGLI